MQTICTLAPESRGLSTKYLTIYHKIILKFIVKSYDSDLKCTKISLRNIVSWFRKVVSDDLTREALCPS